MGIKSVVVVSDYKSRCLGGIYRPHLRATWECGQDSGGSHTWIQRCHLLASSAIPRTVFERRDVLDGDLLAQCLQYSSQTRAFLFIDECPEGIRRQVDSDFTGPVKIGLEGMVTINQFAGHDYGHRAQEAGHHMFPDHVAPPGATRITV